MLGAYKSLSSERWAHTARWVLAIGWLLMIGSLFWDPLSPLLANLGAKLNLPQFNPNQCVEVQGQCLGQQPVPIALFVFWSIVVPSSILILLVFGHETWRRICPLSFLSQLPRALGIQRKRRVGARGAGTTRYELYKIRKDSWLGKYHLYVQFGLLTLGLAARLLVLNSDAFALGTFLLATIALAIAIGFLYEGKSWCQYFCPMAPVQMVFNGPRGLLGSEAHQGQRQTVTQSMCRTVDKDGKEKSACVGCQSPCIDIDAERNYWETATKPGRRFVQYGYVGLLIGFFIYYFLYAGNFEYLFSGAWLRETNQASTWLNSGFYIAGQASAIPKVAAVPLTLVICIGLSYGGLSWIEKHYQRHFKRSPKSGTPQQVTHTLFSLCTFFCFNTFFFFSSRSLLAAFPFPVHLIFNSFIVLVSTLWLSRTLNRSAELYTRESLANSLRRQLGKLTIDFSRFLEGRSMEDLKAEEVYVLAKVLPGVNQEQSLQVYKGVLRETLEQGNADSASSLEVLRPIRQELNIKDEDHFALLTELGSVEPELMDPRKRRTRENQLRIESYRQALASMLLDLVDSGMSLQDAMQRQRKQLQFLKLEYGMTTEEEEKVLSQILAGEKATILRKADALLNQMQQLALRDRVLHDPDLNAQTSLFKLLRLIAVQQKQQILTKQMLGLLEVLGDIPEALELATATRLLASPVLPEILQTSEGTQTWKTRLKPNVLIYLESPVSASGATNQNSAEQAFLAQWAPQLTQVQGESTSSGAVNGNSAAFSSSTLTAVDVLDELIHELDPLIQAIALYGLNLLDTQQAQAQAAQMSDAQGHWLIQETAEIILTQPESQTLKEMQTLIAQIAVNGKVEKHFFQQPVVRVGSSPLNDIVLPQASVAKHHAIFYLDGDDYSVLDLGSSEQGLSVGAKHLEGDRDQLHQGETIRFGNSVSPTITVHWKKQPIQTKQPSATLSTLDKVLLLFESRFFRSLNPDALIELGRNALVKVYSRGEELCHVGDPSTSILLLIDGIAEVIVQRGDSFHTVGMVNVGETVGEMGVLTRQQRSATVIASSDYCRALVIQADHFDAVLRQDPEVSRNLLVVLSSRLQSMTNKLKATAKT